MWNSRIHRRVGVSLQSNDLGSMKKYDRETGLWISGDEVERKASKRKLCKGGRMYCKEADGSVFHVRTGSLKYEIIGHPIQLNHWLKVLDKQNTLYELCNSGVMYWNVENRSRLIHFNLTTGQPETESDYQKFNQIVGI